MTNEQIANRFLQLSRLIQIRGEDYFRARSYQNASEAIRDIKTPLAEIYRREGTRGLQEIPTVGKAISQKIIDLIERGTFEAWERLTAETPLSVLDVLAVDGVNLKLASELYTRFQVKSVDDLREFAEGGGLELLDGVSEKTAARIIKAVAR